MCILLVLKIAVLQKCVNGKYIGGRLLVVDYWKLLES